MTLAMSTSFELLRVSRLFLHPPHRNANKPESPFWLQRIEAFDAEGQVFRISAFFDEESNAQLEAEYQKTLQPLPLFEELTEVQP